MATLDRTACWLPDLCEPPIALLRLLIVCFFLALLLTLLRTGLLSFEWILLGRTALFVTWVGLLVAAGLCRLRARIAHQNTILGVSIALAWVVAVTSLCTALPNWLEQDWLLNPQRSLPIALLENNLIALLLSGIFFRYFYLAHELQQRQKLASEAKLEALQARIRPHFLFNSMNTIISLIESDPPTAEQAALNLADLFRAALSDKGEVTSLGEEIRLCEKYLSIERLRMGTRLRWQIDVEAGLNTFLLPRLALQPLFENAVLHGIHPIPEGGKIEFSAHTESSKVVLRLTNPTPASATREKNTSPSGRGMGIENLNARLQNYFGSAAMMEHSRSEHQFTLTITLPKGGNP